MKLLNVNSEKCSYVCFDLPYIKIDDDGKDNILSHNTFFFQHIFHSFDKINNRKKKVLRIN